MSLRTLSTYVGFCFGALILAILVLIFIFDGAIINSYGKWKVKQAFAEAHPGYALQIGKLNYEVGANRLVAESIMLIATNSTLKIGRISLTGVRWVRLLWEPVALVDILAKASLDATNLDLEYPQLYYGIRCTRLRASVPDSELFAEGIELQPLVGDEEFFVAHAFRTTRSRVVIPECRVLGLIYSELLQGKSYQARSVHISSPFFDALVNRDKPTMPLVKRPLMVQEALATIRQPLQIDSLSITNGYLRYCERVIAGADPGVLTIAAVNMSVEGIANRGETSDAIQIQAQGDIMNAGVLEVLMTIPLTSPDSSLHYSGSLGAMDLTCLDAFLELAEHTRIVSGSARDVTFEIDITAGQARGNVHAIYKDLKIAVLDEQTATEAGWDNRVSSFLANVLKIRNSNPDASGSMKEGEVKYTRTPNDRFLKFVWFALRSGVLDVISH